MSDEKTIQANKDYTASTNAVAKATADYKDVLDEIYKKTQSVDYGFGKLYSSLRNGTKKITEIGPELQRLRERIEDETDLIEKDLQTKKLKALEEKGARALYTKAIVDSAGQLMLGVAQAGLAVTKSVLSSYQSGTSAFAAAGDIATAGIDSANKTVHGVTGVLSGVGGSLMAFGPQAAVAGAALVGFATIANFVSDSMSDLAKFGISTAVKELEKTSKAFTAASGAGAVFAGGFKDFAESASNANLLYDQYAKGITEHAPALAQFGGDLAEGIKRFGGVNQALASSRKGLIALGYSVDDIVSGAAEYMGVIGMSAAGRAKSDREIAFETEKYLVNLKQIQAFTGEDAKKAKERANAALAQGNALSKVGSMAGDTGNNLTRFSNIVKVLPEKLQPGFNQLFGLGTVTGETAIALSQVPAGMELLQRANRYANDSTLDAAEASRKLEKDLVELAPAIRQQSAATQNGIALTNTATGKYSEAVGIINQLQLTAIKAQGVDVDALSEKIKTQKEKQDGLSESYANAVVQLQDMNVTIQTKMIPVMEDFARVTEEILDAVAKQLARLGFGTIKTVHTPGITVGTNAGGAATSVIKNTRQITPGSLRDLQQQKFGAGSGRGAQSGPTAGQSASGQGRENQSKFNTGQGQGRENQSTTGALNFKDRAEATGGGGTDSIIMDMLSKISERFPGMQITALNDIWHQKNRPDSLHTKGLAADIKIDGMNQAMAAEITAMISGLKGMAMYEGSGSNPQNPNGHIHIQAKQMDLGGTLGVGESAVVGEMGPEIVTGPGSVTSRAQTTQLFAEMSRTLKDIHSTLKDSHTVARKTLNAVA
jgi:hypothetical protein